MWIGEINDLKKKLFVAFNRKSFFVAVTQLCIKMPEEIQLRGAQVKIRTKINFISVFLVLHGTVITIKIVEYMSSSFLVFFLVQKWIFQFAVHISKTIPIHFLEIVDLQIWSLGNISWFKEITRILLLSDFRWSSTGILYGFMIKYRNFFRTLGILIEYSFCQK